eukprot:CAMPEP_0171164654 /NCGR_PEP_ID=MMETSP0790-20130122/5782_1 /TAXON_ID=2925 /ORGANISM="Alexandrium catenella, Strain OF101" /LENGTH=173 /DNA_ID=CAMNT_0011629421 /DNA_START=88 /DNA_END=605 /DNA_ORIENTATION=+
MRPSLHNLLFHGRRIVESAKAPLWRTAWGEVQKKCGGQDKFPSYEEFLGSATDIYKYLQGELLAAENTRHLEDLCTEQLWPVVRATGGDFEKMRRHWGAHSVDPFVCSLAPPEDPKEGDEGAVVIAGARFYSVMGMAFAPNEPPRHTIDDIIFKSSWTAERGVAQWKIAYIGG